MEASYRLSYEEFLKQFLYVNRVVNSCINPLQRKTAENWALDWAERMREIVPCYVPSSGDLYLSVIDK